MPITNQLENYLAANIILWLFVLLLLLLLLSLHSLHSASGSRSAESPPSGSTDTRAPFSRTGRTAQSVGTAPARRYGCSPRTADIWRPSAGTAPSPPPPGSCAAWPTSMCYIFDDVSLPHPQIAPTNPPMAGFAVLTRSPFRLWMD